MVPQSDSQIQKAYARYLEIIQPHYELQLINFLQDIFQDYDEDDHTLFIAR